MNTNTGEVKPTKSLTNDEKKNGEWKEIDASRLTPLQQKQLTRTGRTVVSRNSPCPCGSGKRFKRCCKTEAR